MMVSVILILGLLIGSFLNVCIYRIPRNKSIIFPPSHCTNCGDKIKPYDLVPLLSYIFLKGKCRSCGEKISIQYPFVELITGLLFVSAFVIFSLNLDFVKYIILISILITVSIIDLEHKIIPGKIMIFGAISGLVLDIVITGFNTTLLTYLYGMLTGGGIILLIVLLTKGMGGGDIQLMAVVGLFVGFKGAVLTLLLSFLLGASAGVILILFKKKSRKDYIPFGPWISIAALITVFFGNYIINWYFSLL